LKRRGEKRETCNSSRKKMAKKGACRASWVTGGEEGGKKKGNRLR